MPDLLVQLYRLPPRELGEGKLPGSSLLIRRANTFELTKATEFIQRNFSRNWADEMQATFARQPVTGFIAIEDGAIVGFAAYEATRRAFFGPTGVAVSHRGRGLGKRLLIASLWGLADLGYAYGIIGSAGPVDFYQRTVGAILIPDSSPGIYTDLLK
jgi:predicted N-acetyltransferase YhbS